MKTLQRLYEFFFHRWKSEVIEEGRDNFSRAKTTEEWFASPYPYYQRDGKGNIKYIRDDGLVKYSRSFIKYKLTNKFDGSVKIKKKYID